MRYFITSALCAAALAFFSGTSAYAQGGASSGKDFKKVGAGGSQFLKIGVGARSAAMAGAYSGVANDLTAIYWNPAGVAEIDGIDVNFNVTNWFGGFSHNFVAAMIPLGEQYRVAASITSFSSGNIEVTTLDNPFGTGSYYNISDFALGLTFAGRLTEQFSFGINGKYVQQSFSSLSSSGIVFDIGTKYATGIQGIQLGFSVNNLGGDLSYSGQDLARQLADPYAKRRPEDGMLVTNSYGLPLSFRAGLAADILDDKAGVRLSNEAREYRLLVGLDFETLSDTPEQYAAGAEFVWNDLVSLRAGYRIGQDQQNLSGGLGLKYDGGSFKGGVDYSATNTKTMGLIHRLSIAVNLR